MEDPSEYDIEAMALLVTMKQCIANATGDDGADQTHLAGRIEGLFLCHLVTAKILQVNDIESARYTKWLHDHIGWTGTACFSVHLDDDLKNDIVKELDGVPYRTFSKIFGAAIFHTPTQ
ncbi:hypothetical protein POM88_036410 [Heracleum sosnowskyi]|uniref:Uncharacterized protein n=1 Tax=Heracleum sosnowskyi TaxID=360622 RepID=A0AAD8HPZ9_9APIA|nr:hypothetical protein POM88_036410 [Heracleum sosnowskyi]